MALSGTHPIDLESPLYEALVEFAGRHSRSLRGVLRDAVTCYLQEARADEPIPPDAQTLIGGPEHAVWSPYGTTDAAQALLEALEQDRARS